MRMKLQTCTEPQSSKEHVLHDLKDDPFSVTDLRPLFMLLRTVYTCFIVMLRKFSQNAKKPTDEPPPTSSGAVEEKRSSVFQGRRKSVFCETYNPEDDEEEKLKVVIPKTDEQRQRLKETIANIFMFRSLDKEQIQTVLDAMFEKNVVPGEYIIKQGDDGDNFYVIESGTYKAFSTPFGAKGKSKPKQITTYNGFGSFGELALLHNMPRAATIQAVTAGKLWAMDRDTFRHIVLQSAFKKRIVHEALINNVPMLRALRPYERMNLSDALVAREYGDGVQVIKQGDTADGMYFVVNGTVRITLKGADGKEKEVKRIAKGGYFGELALVTKKPRAVSVYAVGDVKLAFLDVDAFERLLGPCMQIMKRNINDYEEQLVNVLGTEANRTDLREA